MSSRSSFKRVIHAENSDLFCWCEWASGSRERRLRWGGSFCAGSPSGTLPGSEGEGVDAGMGLRASGTGHGCLQHVVWVSKRISRDCRRANPQSLSRAFRSSKQNLSKRTQLQDQEKSTSEWSKWTVDDARTMGLHSLYAMVVGAGCLPERELGHFSGSEIRRQLECVVPKHIARTHQRSTRHPAET